MGGVLLNQGDRTSKVQCKGYVDGTTFRLAGVGYKIREWPKREHAGNINNPSNLMIPRVISNSMIHLLKDGGDGGSRSLDLRIMNPAL